MNQNNNTKKKSNSFLNRIKTTYHNLRTKLDEFSSVDISINKNMRHSIPTSEKIVKRKNEPQNIIVKAISFMTNAGLSRANRFYPCEYDIDLIKTAINTDSYLKVAIQKNTQLFFKAGYTFRSENDEAAKYIERRFRIMDYCTGQSGDILWKGIQHDLECFSNAFLIKSRVDTIPFVNAKGITNSGKPVGGYFRVDPSTISVKYDDNGYVTKYKQRLINGKEKDFSPEDVIHFVYDAEAGSIWGTPRMVASLEDIKLLRHVEGSVISMMYRFAMPLIHLKVGTQQLSGSDKEVRDAQRSLEGSPPDGIYVTNERSEFKAVALDGATLDASSYLTYFENRVFSVLNMSQAMMGRGGSKQDADSMEEQMHNKIKNDQNLFAVQFRNEIINELLLEGGFDPISNENDVVNFVFNEVNTDTKVKLENHELTKFTANLITIDEARHNIGIKSDNLDESRLYANMIQQKNELEQIEVQNENAIALAKISAANSADSSDSSSSYTKKNTGNGKTTQTKTGGTNAAKSKNQPSNQHGTFSAKVSESYLHNTDSLESRVLQEKIKLLCNRYDDLCNKLLERDDENAIKSCVNVYIQEYSDVVNNLVKSYTYYGSKAAANDLGETYLNEYSHIPYSLNIYVENTLKRLFSDIAGKAISYNSDYIKKESAINSMKYRVRFLCDYAAHKAYWYSYLKTANDFGITEAIIQSNKDGNHSLKDGTVIKTSNFSLDDIPSFSANCSCSAVLRRNTASKNK
jgi:hypothetical protein